MNGRFAGAALVCCIAFSLLAPALARAEEPLPVSTSSTATTAAKPPPTAARPPPTAAPATKPARPTQVPKRPKIPVRTGDYRNPQGSLSVTGVIDASASTGRGTTIVFGLGIGYAILTGVLPGIRGVLITNSERGVGGELAGSLTLTPPLTFAFTPFAYGEAGRRFVSAGSGWLYGGGGGLYLGDPSSRVSFQLGWVFRRLKRDDGKREDASGPLIGVAFRL